MPVSLLAHWRSATPRRRLFLVRLAAVLLFLLVNIRFLFLPYHSDDILFLKEVSGRPGDWPSFFAVDWGWFYRPVYLLYLGIAFDLTHRSSLLMHAGGVLLQAAATALLGTLAWRITHTRRFAWLTAIVFILYPLKNEAVWWISANSAILAAIFSLLCLHCWISFRQSEGGGPWLAAALLCFALALGSKDEAVATPAGCLIVDSILFPGTLKSLRRLWPYLLLLLLTALALVLYSEARLHVDQANPRIVAVMELPLSVTSALLIPFALWLAPFDSENFGVNLWIAGLPALLAWRGRESRFLVWALVAAMPVGIAVGHHAVYDRFQYYPALPFSLFIAWLLLQLRRPDLWRLKEAALFISHRVFTAALAVPCLRYCIGALFGAKTLGSFVPPRLEWAVIFLTALTALGLFRCNKLPRAPALLILGVAVFHTAGRLLTSAGHETAFILVGATMPLFVALLCQQGVDLSLTRESTLPVMAASVLLWPYPAFSLPVFLLLWWLDLPRFMRMAMAVGCGNAAAGNAVVSVEKLLP